MKKILIALFILIGTAAYSQIVTTIPLDGYTIVTGSLDSVAGTATNIYFRFEEPVNVHTIQFIMNQKIAGAAASAYLYGSNVMNATSWTAIGDTLALDSAGTAFTTPIKWTGTTFPYAIGKITIPETDLTQGSVKIHFFYY